MTTKKSAPTDEELMAQFEGLGTESPTKPSKTTTAKPPPKQAPAAQPDSDLFADLENIQSQRASRPGTPSVRASGAQTRSTATPPPGGRSSEEKSTSAATGARKSGESTRSSRQVFTPATTDDSPEPEPKTTTSSGGGWWGGLLSTATAAVSQAQAAVKEIQKNEEAQKWASQVRGNVGALKGFGGDISALALPALQNLMHTIAPPISSHERLQIHITHDLTNYPSLDPIIYTVFSRVMSQVEGGDLMVIQRGHESSPRRSSGEGSANRNVPGWSDGPWWRDQSAKRSLNAVRGEVEGSKLARAGAESYSTEYFASRGGVEEATKQAAETLSESNPVRNSDIFLAIQGIVQPSNPSLFKPGPSAEKEATVVKDPADKLEDENRFAIYLHDPVHGIAFSALTQSVPGKWIDWLDADDSSGTGLPDSIREIIESGGVDPREWVAEWVEEAITLGVGVVAQRYVARRMGVGEGGRGKGKMKAEKSTVETMDSGGGEVARAV
ncbi:MAG: hypothetical protein Q9227_000347 [Pyrenula ochraceoflavens]